MNPWDQQPGESDKAFNAFNVFLNQPAQTRSVVGAYRVLYRPDAKFAATYFKDWSLKHNWTKRAGDWDRYLIAKSQEEQIKAVQEAAARRAKAYDTLITVGLTVISKAKLADLPEGMARNILFQAIEFIDRGARGQRLELGEPTEHGVYDIRTGESTSVPAISEGTLAAILSRGGLASLLDTEGES